MGGGNGAGWVRVPKSAAFDKRLSCTERLVLVALLSFDFSDARGKSKGYCWPSVGTLAELVGRSRRTIQAALARLEAVGYIRVEHNVGGPGGGSSNRYHLVLESDVQKTAPRYASDAQFSASDVQKIAPPDTQKIAPEEEEDRRSTTEEEETYDPRIRDFMDILKATVAPSTFGAYLADMRVSASDGLLVVAEAHGMAATRLRPKVESAAKQAGFAAVVFAEQAAG